MTSSQPHQTPRPAVFLDRDGTIIRDVNYLRTADQIELLPGVPDALRQLRSGGFLLVLVTNQSAVARGYVTEDDVRAVHDALQALLRPHGAQMDAIYYSPYLPEGTVPQYARRSECRKPAPGMLLQAARELNIDLTRSYMVGDKDTDVEAGRRANCRTVLLGSPGGQVQPDLIARDLPHAAAIILEETRRGD